jgi:hypothetical protein
MFGIDTIYDYWRLLNAVLGVLCMIWLIGGLIKQYEYWNTKTRDLWYSRLMWSGVGIGISIEGIIYDRGMTYTLVFVTAASLITFKGLNIKGSWGYEA